MKTLKVYFYYWFASLFFILLVLYFFNSDDAVIDINIHDTYYVIKNYALSESLAIYFALIGFIYWLFSIDKIQIIVFLKETHTLLTLGLIPIYFIGYFLLDTVIESKFPLFDETSKLNLFITILVIVFIVSQLLFILNIILSIAKHFTRKN